MRQDGKSEKTALETIDAILRFEKQNEQALAPHHRALHAIGGFVGTVNFIFLQLVAVGVWFGFNLIFPNHAIDEYPFPLLATVLALEAVLLTSCVLIRQNLTDQALERRDHLELQINLLAERETTRSLRILQSIAARLGVTNIEGGEQDELADETSVDEIANNLRVREKQEKEHVEQDE